MNSSHQHVPFEEYTASPIFIRKSKAIRVAFGTFTAWFFGIFSSTALMAAFPTITWVYDKADSLLFSASGPLDYSVQHYEDFVSSHGSPAWPWSNTLVSPSGLWSLEIHLGSLLTPGWNPLNPGEPAVEFFDGFVVGGNYLGSNAFFFSTPGGFGDIFLALPAGGSDGIYTYPEDSWEDLLIGWGNIQFEGSDLEDFSTWSYTFSVSVENPYYVAPPAAVPDEGTTAWMAGIGFVLLYAGTHARRVRG